VRKLPAYPTPQDAPSPDAYAITARELTNLGLTLLKQHRYAEAESVLRESLAIREEKLPDDWLRFHTMSALGDALLGQQKYVEARRSLLRGYEGMKQREAKIPPHAKKTLAEAADRIVRLYEATGRAEQASVWRRKLPREVAPPPRPKSPP
jgi:tetratricopeptide (TPR) repeat protein